MADAWIVIKQEQTVGRQPDNSFGPVMRVTFRTQSGVVRYIDVPEQYYTADTVRDLIDAAVHEIDAVSSL